MKVILTAIGSAGDVHPLMGIALKMRERGHQVVFATNPYFELLVRRAGLDFVPLLTVDRFEELTRNPDLWHRTKGIQTIAEQVVGPLLPLTYKIVSDHYLPGETVVVAHSLDFGSRIAHEKLGVPLATVHFAPAVFRSVYRSPYLPPMLSGPRIPKWFKRFQYWIADTWLVDPLLRQPVNEFRAQLGLAPVRRFFDEWWHSPQQVIGMFPAWYGPPQPDWPPQTALTSFPLWDESDMTELAPEVEEFLDAGDPPIVFTPGSAMFFGHDFFRAAAGACARLKCRGVLLTRNAEQLPATLPAGVRHFDFVPLSRLLPRAAAVVHHGGIGTLSQGLQAGIPHLVMPMTHDQPDNASRLVALGVARTIWPRHFRAPRVARALAALTTSPDIKNRCGQYATRLKEIDGLEETCRVIDRMFG